MRRETASRFNRQLAFNATASNFPAVLLGLMLAAAAMFYVTNVQVSQRILEGRFIRWTVDQSDKGQPMPRVFVDLPDGGTIMAVAWADWRPPEAGNMIRVEEQSLRWYGRRYRLVR